MRLTTPITSTSWPTVGGVVTVPGNTGVSVFTISTPRRAERAPTYNPCRIRVSVYAIQTLTIRSILTHPRNNPGYAVTRSTYGTVSESDVSAVR